MEIAKRQAQLAGEADLQKRKHLERSIAGYRALIKKGPEGASNAAANAAAAR